MQISQLIRLVTSELKHTSDSPQLEAEILLAHALGLSRAQLYARGQEKLSSEEECFFIELIERRKHGEPIAYILGQREFWSLPLEITADTLIPRPETELLVELALQQFPRDKKIKVADLGTGSGAIALAIAFEQSHWQVMATDAHENALQIAKKNAERLKLHNIEFRLGHWCDALHHDQFHLIVSNPPYIHEHDPHLTQGDVRFEPKNALISPEQGLRDLKIIIECAYQHLLPGGWLLLEHGYNQSRAVIDLLQKNHYINIVDQQDFAGIDRVAIAQRPEKRKI